MKKFLFIIFLFSVIVNNNTAYAKGYYDDDYDEEEDRIGMLYFSIGGSQALHSSTSRMLKTPKNDLSDIVGVKKAIDFNLGLNIFKFLAIEAEYNYGITSTIARLVRREIDANENIKEEDFAKLKSSSHQFLFNIVPKIEIFNKSFIFIKLGIGYGYYQTTGQETFTHINPVSPTTIHKVVGSFKGMTTQIAIGIDAALNKHNSIVVSYNYRFTPKLQYTKGSMVLDPDYSIIEGVTPSNPITRRNVGNFKYGTITVAYKLTI